MTQDQLDIVEVVHDWALWRDAGDWERFRTVWHDDGWMSATWWQGPAAKFVDVSKAGFEQDLSILHFLGGSSVEVKGQRAIAQTKMTISQRATDPSASIKLDPDLLGTFPEGYRHLGYLQSKLGFAIKRDMPQLKGPVVERLYRHGRAWLEGAASAFPPEDQP